MLHLEGRVCEHVTVHLKFMISIDSGFFCGKEPCVAVTTEYRASLISSPYSLNPWAFCWGDNRIENLYCRLLSSEVSCAEKWLSCCRGHNQATTATRDSRPSELQKRWITSSSVGCSWTRPLECHKQWAAEVHGTSTD